MKPTDIAQEWRLRETYVPFKRIRLLKIASFLLLSLFFVSNAHAQDIRIVDVDPATEWVTIKNFGTDTIDISNYWLCQRPQYDRLGDEDAIRVVFGDLVLSPGEEVLFSVSPDGQSGEFNPITDLPDNGELGLFSEANFGSTDAQIYLDFVSWGGVTEPTRADQAVSAGRWDAAGSFVTGIAPFTFIGDGHDVGADFWKGTANVRIVNVDPNTDWVTIKNFGTEPIDISSYWLCQRPQYDQLGDEAAVSIVSGDLFLDPDEEVTVNVSPDGQSGNFNAITDLKTNDELGLFSEATFGSVDPAVFIDFVTWGGVTSPTRAEQAVTAGRWDAAESFVKGVAPFVYLGGANNVGADFWQGGEIDFDIRIVAVDPATEWVTIKNFGSETIDISNYWLCQRPQYDRLGDAGSTRIVFGDLVLSPGEEVLISVSPAGPSGDFSPITDLPDNGELGLFAEASFGSTDPTILLDFVSWGGITEPTRAEQAVSAGRWDAAESFVDGLAPFDFIGNADDVGADFWEGRALDFNIRIINVDPATEWVTIKNFGSETIDISGYWLCQRPQYDRLGDAGAIRIIFGDLVLDPEEEVLVSVSPAGQSGEFSAITDLPDNGELGLFANASFGSTDPDDLLDFVTWGGITEPTRVEQAVAAGRWDLPGSFAEGGAPFSFIGEANDVGANFWEGEEDEAGAIVRISFVDPINEYVTIKNFGTETIDISSYWLCQRPQYDQLGESGSIAIIAGDFLLEPGEEVVIDVSPAGASGGFTAITDLPDNGELGLFSEASFGSIDPEILLDFVSWGGVTEPTRADQAFAANRWDDVASFVEGNAPFTYIGGADDIGASFWEGGEGVTAVRIVGVDPSNEWVTIKNFGDESVDISNYWLCQRPQYDQLGEAGSITIVEGDFLLEPGEEVIVNVSPAGQSGGFTAITDLPENGELGLFADASFGSTDPETLLDFVSWGGVNDPSRAEQAVTAGRWDDVASFVGGAAPYTFLGDAADIGPAFWVGDTEIRMVLINPFTDLVVLENVDDVALDISSFFFCTQAGVYPQLGNPEQVEVVEGDLNLEPGEKVAVRVLTDGGVIDEGGTLFLFSTNALGFNNGNPASLRDFAQWDSGNGFRVDNAVAAGRWDNAGNFILGSAPFFVDPVTPGEFGSTVWNARSVSVRMVRIDPANAEVTLRNFGDVEVDVSGYYFCLNIGQYEKLTGENLLIAPGQEITVSVSTGLDANNPDNLGLFSTDTFSSTNPDIYVDFVQWGGRDDQGRPDQAVYAGVWPDANAFIEIASLFEFTGNMNDFDTGDWTPVQNVSVESPFDELPTTTVLETNYPNPFNPETTIAFSLPEGSQVQLTVYDVIGRQVATLVDDVLSAGRHEIRFQAGGLPSGTYLYRLVTPTGSLVKTMSLLK